MTGPSLKYAAMQRRSSYHTYDQVSNIMDLLVKK